MNKKKKSNVYIKYLIYFYMLILFFSFQDATEISGNILLNPGFEELNKGFPVGWLQKIPEGTKIYYVRASGKTAHSGKYSMEIGRVWTEPWELTGFKTAKPISIKPDKKYILSFWYKMKDLHEYPKPLIIRFKIFRQHDKSLVYKKILSTTDKWTHIYWLLESIPPDATSVDLEFCLWMRTEGSVFIDDLKLNEANQTEIEEYQKWRKMPLAQPVGNASLNSFKGTGNFQVLEDEKRWWLVDPTGRATWAIATVGEVPGKGKNGNIKLKEWFDNEYEKDQKGYALNQYELLEKWGFNFLAGWTAEIYAKITDEKFTKGAKYMPMFHVLELSNMGEDKKYYAKDKRGKEKNKSGHYFPDPFNPLWRQDAYKKARAIINQYRDKPWFVGWFIDNELDLGSLFRYVWGKYSSQEFIRFLKDKYKEINNLNKSWTSSFGIYNYTSFNDILLDKPEPAEWDDPLFVDFIAFERIMTKEYIDYTYNLVKKLDPNHLVISNRFDLGYMICLYRTIDLWSKYDVIAVNIYPENLYIGFDQGELEILDWIYKQTGKPIIIGEWSVPALDSNLYEFGPDPYNRPMDGSWSQALMTQKERGETYHACMLTLTSKPYIIGAAWYKMLDIDSLSRRANRGLIDSKNNPYKEMIEMVIKTNYEIIEKMKLVW